MLARRIIPCLDVSGGRVVKGVRFQAHQDVGDPAEMAAGYAAAGADEIVIYDISASTQDRTIDFAWVREVARALDVPLCVAGGIRSLAHAMACLESGADKISINTPALLRPELIDELVAAAGSQCVVVGIDSLETPQGWKVQSHTGDATSSRAAGRATLEWAEEAQSRGAGEVVLNCMNRDGVRQGYDVGQLAAVRAVLTIPLIASGGAGEAAHFTEAFQGGDVSGALAASVFHSGRLSIGDLKRALAADGVEVRL